MCGKLYFGFYFLQAKQIYFVSNNFGAFKSDLFIGVVFFASVIY